MDQKIKPCIYWKYYPKSKRGYWRVKPMPTVPNKREFRELWNYAYTLAIKMNLTVERR